MDPKKEDSSTAMTDSNFLWNTDGVLSNRVGADNMDGRTILLGRESKYVRPWNSCITLSNLANDNLPPFHVRLRDDQVGHLSHFARSSRKSIPVQKLGLWWSWDFDAGGKILSSRDNWGQPYVGPCTDPGKTTLRGGRGLPTYVDPCLPPTYTSSDKIMPQGTSGLSGGALRKRKATEGTQSGGISKKPCLEPNKMTALKAEQDKKDIKPGEPIFEAKPRLFVDNYSGQEALTFYETLTSEVRQSQSRIVELENELQINETEASEDYDNLHDEWTKCYNTKQEEVEKFKVELQLSDTLLHSSKNTVTQQGKQLTILEKTQNLLQEKEQEIQSQKDQLARWEAQARAMLGGGLPKPSTDEKSITTTTPKPHPVLKAESSKAKKLSVKELVAAPKQRSGASQILKPTPEHLNPIPQVSKSNAKAPTKPDGVSGRKYTFFSPGVVTPYLTHS